MIDIGNYFEELDHIVLELGKSFDRQSTSIFCGAGISYNSGLPLAISLIKNILSIIDVNETDSLKIENSNLPFEAFIQTLNVESDTDDILEIFSKGEPNTNHELIAELVIRGHVRTVLTTNFDLLIEQALENKGFKKGLHFEIYTNEKEFGKIDWKSDTIKLIKIHGCVSNKEEMAITLEAVASQTISQNKANVINSFFSNKINPNIFVVGYSCSDSFDISPQIELIDTDRSKIFYLEHCNTDSEFSVENISIKDFKNPFQNFLGKRININADTLFKKIWESVLPSPYQFKTSSFSWQENINKWISLAVEYSIGIKNHISARLFYDIGEYELSIEQWEKGIIIAQTERNQMFFYGQLGNLGMAFNALGRYNEAQKCLEESVNACLEIGNIQGEIAQLQALGNVYRNLREFDSAIKVYKRAVALAEKNELDGLCTSLGNLATVYNQTQQPEEAIKTLQKGIAIALATGNKQSEGSMLCSLGITYFQKGEYGKASSLIQESVNVTRLIGDRQGKCMALLNLSNLCLQFEDFDNCLKHATISLQIAQTIGIRQSEAGAYYNIGSSFYFKGDAKSAIPNLEKAIEIYTDIFGTRHTHTLSAIKALYTAKNYPEFNEI